MAKSPGKYSRSRRTSHDREQLILRACDLFFREKCSVREVAEQLTREDGAPVSSHDVYAMLNRARDLQAVRLVAGQDRERAATLSETYQLPSDSVTVVDVERPHLSGEYVAEAAAEVVLSLIRRIADAKRGPVGVGLGSGRFTLDFSHCLARLLRIDPAPPDVQIHALTAAAPVESPELSPNSFFNVFPPSVVRKCVGMFTDPLVRAAEFEAVRRRFGFQKAYEARGEIDIVVTSLGDPRQRGTPDRRSGDLYRYFLESAMASESPESDVDAFLARHDIVGNIQYRPYTRERPVQEAADEYRAVTLFDIEDYVKLCQRKNKHVVLMVRRLADGRGRTEALLPLLRSPQLRVFSELVLDAQTCRELLQRAPDGAL